MEATTLERLEERGPLPTSRVDRVRGIIPRVKILGLESANGRSYSPRAVREAAKLYENVRVNIDHTTGPRAYEQRFGWIANVVANADGLRGDLHYNTEHKSAKTLAWFAEHSPESVGLSHSIEGRTSKKDGRTVVEEITKVFSVDVVTDPATTRSLFESRGHFESAGGERDKFDDVTDYRSFVEAVTGLPRPTGESLKSFIRELRA